MKAKMRPEEIARLLRRAIREREFLPGDQLNQDELAKRFGVSRIPLREALRTLAGEGLIVMRPNFGAVVTEVRAEEMRELYGLRLQLEPSLAADIVEKCKPQDLEELRGILARMDEAARADVDRWADLHYLFHRRIDEISERQHTLRLLIQVLNLIEPYSRMHVQMTGIGPHKMAEHDGILSALEAGDAGKLSEAMAGGIADAEARLLARMEQEAPEPDPIDALLEERL